MQERLIIWAAESESNCENEIASFLTWDELSCFNFRTLNPGR